MAGNGDSLFQRLERNFVVTRMHANLFIARLEINLIKHGLPPQRLGDAFGFVFSQRTIGIDAGYFKNALIQANHAERSERHTRRNLDVVYVVNLKVAGLLDPVLDERIAQRVLGLAFVEIGAFDDQAVLAAFILSHCAESSWTLKADAAPAFSRERRLAIFWRS